MRAEHSITPTLRTVWRLVALGLSNKEIGVSLRIAPNTVHTHLAALFEALGIDNRQHALILALTHGVVTLEDALALLPHIVPADPCDVPSPWLPPKRSDMPAGALALGALQLTADQIAACRERREIPAGVLAVGMGVHRATITNIKSGRAFHRAEYAGIGERKQGIPLLQGDALQRAITLRRGGASWQAIADDHGAISWKSVLLEVTRAIGVTKNAHNGRVQPTSRASRVWPYVQQGISNAEIARRTGMSRSQVSTAVWQCQRWAKNRKPYWAKQEAM